MKRLLFLAAFWPSLLLAGAFPDTSSPGGGGGGGGIEASDNTSFTGTNTFQSSTTFNGTVALSSGIVLGGSAGSSGEVLTSGGAGAVPTWGAGTATYTLLASSTIAGATGVFDFTSISQAYDHLIVEVYGRSSIDTESAIVIAYNNDTTAGNYISRTIYHQGGAVSTTGGTARLVGYAPRSSTSSYNRTVLLINIYNYTETAYSKTAKLEADAFYDDSTVLDFRGMLVWQGATQPAPAINRITISITGGAFTTGSKANLIGVNY